MLITATRAVRQALFAGIRVRQSMDSPHCHHLQQVRTFIPLIVPIYNWGNTTTYKPKKDEEDYEQKFDFRMNPLFQCNPIGVNDTVNSGFST